MIFVMTIVLIYNLYMVQFSSSLGYLSSSLDFLSINILRIDYIRTCIFFYVHISFGDVYILFHTRKHAWRFLDFFRQHLSTFCVYVSINVYCSLLHYTWYSHKFHSYIF